MTSNLGRLEKNNKEQHHSPGVEWNLWREHSSERSPERSLPTRDLSGISEIHLGPTGITGGYVSPQYRHMNVGYQLPSTRGVGIVEAPLDSHDSNIEVKVTVLCI